MIDLKETIDFSVRAVINRKKVDEQDGTKLKGCLPQIPGRKKKVNTRLGEVELDREAAERLMRSIEEGKGYTPQQLHSAIFNGTREERMALRRLFAGDRQQATNQDLMMPFIAPALDGIEGSQKVIEQHRVIIQEKERRCPGARTNP